MLEVIQLKYRRVDEVIPILRPLVPAQGSLSGLNNQLIVRTTPQNLEEIKRILAAIDAAPRRLMVSVRQDADLERSQRGGQISGSARVGDNVTVTVPGRPTPPGASARVDDVRAKVYSSEAQNTDRVSQQVQVLEGSRAFIRVGQSVPVRTRQYVDTPGGRRIIDTTGFQDVDTGFYVVPRVSGRHRYAGNLHGRRFAALPRQRRDQHSTRADHGVGAAGRMDRDRRASTSRPRSATARSWPAAATRGGRAGGCC